MAKQDRAEKKRNQGKKSSAEDFKEDFTSLLIGFIIGELKVLKEGLGTHLLFENWVPL